LAHIESGNQAEHESALAEALRGLRELAQLKHLQYLSDEVLEEYAEGPE
jgi:hypothetical protein